MTSCLNSAECPASDVCYHGTCRPKTIDSKTCSAYFDDFRPESGGCSVHPDNLNIVELCYKVPHDKIDDPEWIEENIKMSYICPEKKRMMTYFQTVDGERTDVTTQSLDLKPGSFSCHNQQLKACFPEAFVCSSTNVTYTSLDVCKDKCATGDCISTYEEEQYVKFLSNTGTSDTVQSLSPSTSTAGNSKKKKKKKKRGGPVRRLKNRWQTRRRQRRR